MPVAVPLVGLAVSAGMGGLQMAKANREKKKAQQAVNDYKRQDLTNPFGQLSASTLGAQIRQENSARALANIGYQSAMGGSRAIAGILPNALEQQNNMDAQIAADLDQQQAQIDQLKGQGEMRVQTLQEQREIADLAGLGTQLDLANAQATSAQNAFVGGLANGLSNVASAGVESMNAGKGFFGNGGNVNKSNIGIKTILPGAEVENLTPIQRITPIGLQNNSNGMPFYMNPMNPIFQIKK